VSTAVGGLHGLSSNGTSGLAPLVEIDGLVVEYAVDSDRRVRAVDGVSLAVRPGEILGLAGESGCGKTSLGNALLRILRPPAEIVSGSVRYDGVDVVTMKPRALRRFRWRHVSMVFQSAMNALNPVARVGPQFVDMIRAHERVDKSEALARAGDLLELVGIDRRRVRAYPHELSGGMRQRVVIAMALALEPGLIVMDEPTTALDVVVQREILQEIQELQRTLGFAVLFITHDLSLLVELAHRVAIMYAGEIVELAPAERLLHESQHPYTAGLIGSFPPLTGELLRMEGIPGSPPDLADPPTGCRFHPRCPHCSAANPDLHTLQVGVRPQLTPVAPGHTVACHLRASGLEAPAV
jgi:peptide/nickel transport system ATP-binding protein